jgi:hypothetical protein
MTELLAVSFILAGAIAAWLCLFAALVCGAVLVFPRVADVVGGAFGRLWAHLTRQS